MALKNSTRKVTRDCEARPLASEDAVSLLIFCGADTRVERLTEQPRVIGRDPLVDICVDDSSLSRKHARFELAHGRVLVTDLDSTNGLRVNGEHKKHALLGARDEVMMGDVVVAVHVLGAANAETFEHHETFVELMQNEVVRAHHFRRQFALIMAEFDRDLDEPMCEALQQLAAPVGSLARFSPRTVELLLPEDDEIAAKRVGSGLREIDAMVRLGIAIYPHAGTTAESLLSSCTQALAKATEKRPISLAPIVSQSGAPQRLIARSRVMVELLDEIERFANAELPVLLIGETGSGKEMVAHELHRRGRRGGPLVCINCGAIPSTLTESVLFGHERGAFTGADARKQGIFEQARGGTVLLDEVGELSAAAQVALLRVLESRVITRVGGHEEIPVDIRLIAATHRDLFGMCARGEFREDLFYRLEGTVLRIPPLRERPEEIPDLAQLFVERANEANQRSVAGIAADALRPLCRFDWPGNVRQLRNVIERAVVLTTGTHVTPQDLPSMVLGRGERRSADASDLDLRARMKEYEHQLIVEALRRSDGVRQDAAALLNIPLRTLSRKLGEHDIGPGGYKVKL